MHAFSLKKVTLLGFTGPAVIMIGAFASVVLGRGEAAMLRGTLAALALYGILIAVGAAWRDSAPALFNWMPRVRSAKMPSGMYLIRSGLLLVAVLSAGTAVVVTMGWLAEQSGASDLVWRPLCTVAICLWLGVGSASIIQPRERC